MPRKVKPVVKDADAVVCKQHSHYSTGSGGFVYFLGVIGSATYYISTSTGFWNGVLGFLKALVWPAFLVFDLLKFLGS